MKGSFNGQANGAISGKLSGTCDPFLVKIPSGAKFSGIVNKTGKTVPIDYQASGGGLSHDGSMTLSY